MSNLIPYVTAEMLAETYSEAVSNILQLEEELTEALKTLQNAFNTHRFSFELKICETDDREEYQLELKRIAWESLIHKLGIRNILSSKRKNELDAALSSGNRSKEARELIDGLPEITAENMQATLSGMMDQAEEFFDESIEEEYQWLKPWTSDQYKTNEKNRWMISSKVILEWALAETDWFGDYFLPNHGNSQNHLQTLDMLFHRLDGKALSPNTTSPLVAAIKGTPKDQAGKAQETEYFRFKCYKNRNLHLEFTRPDLLAEFNLRCGNDRQLPDLNASMFKKSGADDRGNIYGVPVCPNGDYNFFETPKAVIDRMLDFADIQPQDQVLEPSAGQGAIADRIRELLLNPSHLHCVEIQRENINLLRKKGFDVSSMDFLEKKPVEFADKIVMNPPFSHGRDAAHIEHAFQFLKSGGRLVAVASSGVKFRNDKRTKAFRVWLDLAGGEIHDLPENSFKDSGTGVQTVLIVVDKE